jgi:hypothetical protein
MKAAIIHLSISSHAMTYRLANSCFLVKPQLLTRG